MTSLDRRYFLRSLVAGAALGSTVGASRAFAKSEMSGMNMDKSAAKRAKPDLVFHGQGFSPMTAHVTAGQKIEIMSVAHDSLEIVSAPTAPEKIRHRVAAGATASLRLTKPGLYLLYDSKTTRFDDKVGQVVAKKSAKQFPLPAYAMVLVTNAQNRGLKRTEPKVSIPDSYMTFEPWAIVVNAGEAITFTNDDEDLHLVMPSPEPMIMPKSVASSGQLGSGMWLEHMESFAPITLPGHGGKGVLTLSQPGLHHYYCPIHAAYDPTSYTFAPLKVYGGYPFIMDGVIVVMPA